MSKKIGKLAKRYARALLSTASAQLGTEGSPTPCQQLAEGLSGLARIWEEDPELSVFVLTPKFPQEQRLAALVEVSKAVGQPEVMQNFLKVLVARNRIHALPEIAISFAELADETAGVVQVTIKTARSVDGDERGSIEKSLSQKIGGAPIFSWDIDQTLLGGMVVEFGGKVLDGSVSGRLQRIERSLVR